MRKGIFSALFAFYSLVIATQAAGLELESLDHPVFGIDSLTLDPYTGRKWLDLEHTAGMNLEMLLPLYGGRPTIQ